MAPESPDYAPDDGTEDLFDNADFWRSDTKLDKPDVAQTVFERAKIGNPPTTEKEKNEDTMVNILGEIEEDTGEKIITKIVSKTNKEGLEKLSTIEDITEKSEENQENPTKTITPTP